MSVVETTSGNLKVTEFTVEVWPWRTTKGSSECRLKSYTKIEDLPLVPWVPTARVCPSVLKATQESGSLVYIELILDFC